MSTIRDLNDAFRKSLKAGTVMLSASVAALPVPLQVAALERVRTFDSFDENNNPYGEHDFGAFELGAYRFVWRIDYYDTSYKYGSDDPSDPEITRRVLTLMLSVDY